MHWPVVLAIVLFPLAMAGLWISILHLIAAVSGWRALARAYASTRPFRGRTFGGVNGWVGMMGYGWSLTVGADAEGLHMSVMRPFRPGQPPLLVPWTDLRVEAGSTFFGPVADLRTSRVPRIRVRLPDRVVRNLARASSGGLEWPVPTSIQSRESSAWPPSTRP
jgi:hypothetical protein